MRAEREPLLLASRVTWGLFGCYGLGLQAVHLARWGLLGERSGAPTTPPCLAWEAVPHRPGARRPLESPSQAVDDQWEKAQGALARSQQQAKAGVPVTGSSFRLIGPSPQPMAQKEEQEGQARRIDVEDQGLVSRQAG